MSNLQKSNTDALQNTLVHLSLQWGSAQIGDIAEAALRACLNKVKFNCGDVAGV